MTVDTRELTLKEKHHALMDLIGVVQRALTYFAGHPDMPRIRGEYVLWRNPTTGEKVNPSSFYGHPPDTEFCGVCLLGAVYCYTHPDFDVKNLSDPRYDTHFFFTSISNDLREHYPELSAVRTKNVLTIATSALQWLVDLHDSGKTPEEILDILRTYDKPLYVAVGTAYEESLVLRANPPAKVFITLGGSHNEYRRHTDYLKREGIEFRLMGAATLGGKRQQAQILAADLEKALKCKGISKKRRSKY